MAYFSKFVADMKKGLFINIIFALISLTGCDMSQKAIITLKNGDVELKIRKDASALLFSVKKNDSQNILKASEDLMHDLKLPFIDENTGDMPLFGHTIWLGPQSEWWQRQNKNLKRKEDCAMWPPDPYWAFDNHKLLFKNDSSAGFIGSHSEFTGVTLQKKYTVNPDGSILIEVSAKNTSDKPVYWDIWFNTRIDGNCRAYVPVDSINDIRTVHVPGEAIQAMDTEISDGYFSYLPKQPDKSFSERSSKTYIYPSKAFIATFSKDKLLIIQFDKYTKAEVHPLQGMVELYSHTTADDKDALLELEYHSPYSVIEPGSEISSHEVWKIFDYKGTDDPEEQRKFLNSKL